MSYKESLVRFNEMIRKQQALVYASSILHWDGSTVAPKSSMATRGQTLGTFAGMEYENLVNPQMEKDLNTLMQNRDKLSDIEAKMVVNSKKHFDKQSKIPKNEVEAFEILVNRAQDSWANARENNDFSIYSKDLKELVKAKKRFAAYRDKNKHPYNLFLDDYEEGMTREKLNTFFDTLKSRIVPLIKDIKERGAEIDDSFLKVDYPIDKQIEAANELLELMKFDIDRGVFTKSTHPFTLGMNIDDVRLTSRYEVNNMISGLLSTAHEGGHALYEQNIDKKLQNTPLATGTSLGIHESQSRIYENNIFKSRDFVEFYLPILKKHFPEQLKNVDTEAFYKAINVVEPGFIRVDADEVTYCLHIMVRYEIEVGLIEGTIEVDKLPEVWNRKMEEYLGIIPTSNAVGVLQDIHWSYGELGYFPTYALGSAYAAQFAYYMQRDNSMEFSDMDIPKKWLNEKIHCHGSMLNPDEVSLFATGEQLNPEYFCNYLEEKYREIYKL